ncbi:unnamed protein product [Diatraea saccharalis]|uniref:Acyltransferase 3 domain-containing protein n=1 Tax=Diatraea saccharalis TaxID=40085 RepID=A0A9N9RG15_9NEOP|nr:unnamed protein product [Diatraea saccharalis]
MGTLKISYFALVLLICLIQGISALKTISDEDYYSFPPLHHVDRFSQCVGVPGGAYCSAEFNIVTDGPNELYEKMRNYSFSAMRHFDYTKPRYGYCITRRCKEFYKGDSDGELLEAMGLCLNHTLGEEYGLRAVVNYGTCYRHGESKHSVTWLDCVAAALFLTIIALAATATYYDLFAAKKDPKGLLMCFSIPANWARLKAPYPKDKMTERLISFSGIRSITALLVIIMHAIVPLMSTIENTAHLEENYEAHAPHFLYNTHIIMQSFFFMSGFFFVYTKQISNEKTPMTWRQLPRAIFLRWLRLTPVHHFVLLYVLTWYKFAPYGPNWQPLVNDEVEDCQKHWPSLLLYYNNYVNNMRCNIHHWTTAADLHMHTIGLLILVLSPTEKIRDAVLWILTAISLVLPVIETYNRDLEGTFIVGFKVGQDHRGVFKNDTFNYLYKRTHTNMTSFCIGMIYGLFLYKWMKKNVDTSKYKKYVYWYWMIFPVCLCLIYTNAFLIQREGEGKASMGVRLTYALLQKLTWIILLTLLSFGAVCRIENVYRRILEWPLWVPLMKLTYCTYNTNLILSLWLYGTNSQLTFASDMHTMNTAAGVVVLTFIFSTILWLLVEQPFINLVKILVPEKQSILQVETTPKKTD